MVKIYWSNRGLRARTGYVQNHDFPSNALNVSKLITKSEKQTTLTIIVKIALLIVGLDCDDMSLAWVFISGPKKGPTQLNFKFREPKLSISLWFSSGMGNIRPARPFYAARRHLQKHKLRSQIEPKTLHFL